MLVSPALARQQSPAERPPATAPSGARPPIALTGCISGAPGASGEFTFRDADSGGRYRLTGNGIRKYAGRRVEIVGGGAKRLSIRGGLLPSPNIAAQAGSIDPAQAAIANQPGGAGPGTGGPLPEFHVTHLRGLDGACQ